MLCWTGYEEIPHIQGQRNPSKMRVGTNLHLPQTLFPPETLRTHTNLVLTRTQGPTETETELCLRVSYGGTGQQWTAAGTGAVGAADLGMA